MSDEIKQYINQLRDELKRFKKVSKTDSQEGMKMAENLLVKIQPLKKLPEIKSDKKKQKEFKLLEEALTLYVSSVKKVNDFKRNWGK